MPVGGNLNLLCELMETICFSQKIDFGKRMYGIKKVLSHPAPLVMISDDFCERSHRNPEQGLVQTDPTEADSCPLSYS